MGLVSLDDVDYGVVEDPSSLLDEASLGDDDLGVVEDPSSLVDEASIGDGARGDGDVLDHSHSVHGFVRWSDENFAIFTLRSDYDLVREACSSILRGERNAHCSHDGRLESHVEQLGGVPRNSVSYRLRTS